MFKLGIISFDIRISTSQCEVIRQEYQTATEIYGIRLSHIFEIPSISNEKHGISKPQTSFKILGISSQKYFEIHLESEVLAKYLVF